MNRSRVHVPEASSARREVVREPAPVDRDAAVLRLQRDYGNTYVVGLLQRLTAPPFDEAKGDFNFGGEAKEVDIDGLGYKALHALQSIHAQKQADPSVHPQFVFKAGDIDKIDKRVAELEGSEKVEQVLCSESEVKSASAKQAIDFGGVTSCMTIACVFEDGSKAGAHEGLFARVPGGSVNRLKGLVQSKKLAKVLAAGDAMTWTLAGGMLKTNFDDATAALISEDKGAAFMGFLRSQLGAGTVEFTQFAEGRIQISAGGELKTG